MFPGLESIFLTLVMFALLKLDYKRTRSQNTRRFASNLFYGAVGCKRQTMFDQEIDDTFLRNLLGDFRRPA